MRLDSAVDTEWRGFGGVVCAGVSDKPQIAPPRHQNCGTIPPSSASCWCLLLCLLLLETKQAGRDTEKHLGQNNTHPTPPLPSYSNNTRPSSQAISALFPPHPPPPPSALHPIDAIHQSIIALSPLPSAFALSLFTFLPFQLPPL